MGKAIFNKARNRIIALSYLGGRRMLLLILFVFIAFFLVYDYEIYFDNTSNDKDAEKVWNNSVHNHIIGSLNVRIIPGNPLEVNEATMPDEPSAKVQKIFLISSSPRTGSSYMANIITAMPNSSYYFEPFWLNRHSSDINKVCKRLLVALV